MKVYYPLSSGDVVLMFWQASEISPLINVDSGVVVPVIADRFVGSQEYVEEVKSLCDGYQV